jgi:hypothetical protein
MATKKTHPPQPENIFKPDIYGIQYPFNSSFLTKLLAEFTLKKGSLIEAFKYYGLAS